MWKDTGALGDIQSLRWTQALWFILSWSHKHSPTLEVQNVYSSAAGNSAPQKLLLLLK